VASTLVNSVPSMSLPAGQTRSQDAADNFLEQQIGNERYIETSVRLSESGEFPVTLRVLKSWDKATVFLSRLNRILLSLGLISVLAGGILVFLISHTFTKPLSSLVAGVHALEDGDYNYPLDSNGGDEVGEVTGAFDRMRTNLRNTLAEQKQLEDKFRQSQKMEAVGRLAGGVAHDFNNLLTVIRGNGDLLLERLSPDPLQLKYLEQIQKAADRAVAMTRQLLAFSRMQVLQPRVLDLNATISEMNKMIPRLIGEHIEFTFTPAPNISSVLADPGQIEQVFLNLAVNARDAMSGGGKLTVCTKNIVLDETEARKRPPMPAGAYVLLAVSDTGHGMDAETKSRIFEPFFTTKEVGKGTGLGLATVYGIVKQTGGFIWVESVPGTGTTFEIYLPPTDRPVSRTDVLRTPGTVPRRKETILLVEDETGVRELASEFLRAGGYTVLEASDGPAALTMVRNHDDLIHLLLTDMVMPGMSGRNLAQKVLEIRPEIRVMFMTGYAEFPDKIGNNSSPPGEILQKPFSRATLLGKVHEIVSSAHRTPV
jgi:two-component system cell cycle sensor histidine kinase/response regulator CckA